MTTITRILPLAILFLFTNLLAGQTRYYVNAAATGANDGTSWANAYLDLQDALAASQYGDEIWVAQGTYYPTATTNREISFELKNGVKLYGGFAGTETQLSQRDWVTNETVLSGDIGVLGDSLDNSYNVVYGVDLDSTTWMDGFKLTGGNADNQVLSEPTYSRKKCGGAIYLISNLSSQALNVANCVFTKNTATYGGGAIIFRSTSNKSVVATVVNCIFSENRSIENGAGIYYIGGVNLPEPSPEIKGCKFISNKAEIGSSVFIFDSFGRRPFKINDSTFEKNTSTASAIFHDSFNSQGEGVIITNCNFLENKGFSNSCFKATNVSFATKKIRFQDCNFVNNQSGCLSFDLGELEDKGIEINGCYFENNKVSVIDFSAVSGSANVKNSVFKNNKNLYIGAISSVSELPLNISGCTFLDNEGTQFAGALNLDNGIISNSIFVNNISPLGGGEIFSLENLQVVNTVFYENNNNSHTTPMMKMKNASFNNVIVQKLGLNAASFIQPTYINGQFGTVYITNSFISILDCDSIPITCGPNMLYNLDPHFVDPDNGDFHLSPCSPARNAGSNAIVDSLGILTDIEGSPRIQGGTVDMGAYESPVFEATGVNVTTQACGLNGLGTVSLTLANGCPPYFLNWGAGSTVSDTSLASLNLPVGSYSVTITDGRMEADTVLFTISAAPAISANAVAFPINCATGMGGGASVEATGGTGSFSFLWSSGGNTASVTGLAEGTYTVTVTDASGCTASSTVTIGTVGSLTLGLSIHPITCPGDSDGTATVQPIGGNMPFNWLWQSGETTATIGNLTGGTYAATVTDALGCTGDIDFTINPPAVIDIDIAVLHPDCFGNPGLCIATASGGTGSFDFLWENGATTATAILPAGPHSVTVTDANGCAAIGSATIPTPPLLELNLNAMPSLLCHGEADASIVVTPTGGTPPYDWGGPLVNLAAGTYTVTVYDANICTATASVTIPELPEITVAATVTHASGPTASDGSVDISTVFGGTGGGYTFDWSNGSTAQNLTAVPTGDYTVTITDAHACTGVFSFFVDFETATGETAQNPFGAAILPNPSGVAGANLLVKNRLTGLRYAVLDALGREIVAEQNIVTEKQPLPSGLAAGIYFIVLKYAEGKVVLKWMLME